MTDKKISELADAGAAAAGDIIPITQASTSTTKRLSVSAIVALVVATIATAATISTLTTSTIKPASDGANSINITKANGTTSVMSFNTTSGNVGIGTTGPGYKLDISGNTERMLNVGNPAQPLYYVSLGLTNTQTSGLLQSPYGLNFTTTANAGPLYDGSMTFTTVAGGGNFKFINGNVGIGTTSPGQKLEVNGGMRLNTATAKPTCAVGIRGTFWVVQGGAGVADTVEACLKSAADTYSWVTLPN